LPREAGREHERFKPSLSTVPGGRRGRSRPALGVARDVERAPASSCTRKVSRCAGRRRARQRHGVLGEDAEPEMLEHGHDVGEDERLAEIELERGVGLRASRPGSGPRCGSAHRRGGPRGARRRRPPSPGRCRPCTRRGTWRCSARRAPCPARRRARRGGGRAGGRSSRGSARRARAADRPGDRQHARRGAARKKCRRA
jgi:hypothetical protein